jgi:hypothetical protein
MSLDTASSALLSKWVTPAAAIVGFVAVLAIVAIVLAALALSKPGAKPATVPVSAPAPAPAPAPEKSLLTSKGSVLALGASQPLGASQGNTFDTLFVQGNGLIVQQKGSSDTLLIVNNTLQFQNSSHTAQIFMDDAGRLVVHAANGSTTYLS